MKAKVEIFTAVKWFKQALWNIYLNIMYKGCSGLWFLIRWNINDKTNLLKLLQTFVVFGGV